MLFTAAAAAATATSVGPHAGPHASPQSISAGPSCRAYSLVLIFSPFPPNSQCYMIMSDSSRLTILLQLGTDGISTASAAIHAALCSTRTQIYFFSAMGPSYATTAPTAAARAATRSKISQSLPANRPSAPLAFGVGIARERSKTCATRRRLKVFFV